MSYKEEEGNKQFAERAAIKIQATYRGFHTRKNLKENYDNHPKGINPCINEKSTRKEMKLEDERQRSKPAADNLYSNKQPLSKADAATRIQAGYRGFTTRKYLKGGLTDISNRVPSFLEPPETRAGEKMQPTHRDYIPKQEVQKTHVYRNARLQMYSSHPDARQNEAATKIQANFRGYQVRKSTRQHAADGTSYSQTHDSTEIEKSKAATTIQAGYRGYRIRRNVADGGQSRAPQAKLKSGDFEADSNRRNMAATKIQANFKGYLVRQDPSKFVVI